MQPECKVSVNIFFALFISLLFNSLMKVSYELPFTSLVCPPSFLLFLLFKKIQADLNIVKYINVSSIKCVQL